MKFVRYAVAYVFIVSGIMKFASPDLSAAFTSLGLPYPLQLMQATAVAEILCGGLIALGRHTRIATCALLVIMAGAIVLTKVPLLQEGLLHFLFSARLDIVMVLLLAVLYSAAKSR